MTTVPNPVPASSTFIDRLRELIDWLETTAIDLPSLPDVSDADMALMYLRHLERHLAATTLVVLPVRLEVEP